ncbi:hypothetical protein MKK75_27495 [Methylobacterium sp. J-030]|uniref:hypothetical protein n=1 Tax=Methylobacterium sp. J-030 TaxID=2836627 RepID=UPI001FBAC847|nr:hypothetical protein [Methylobacterium sp. J-030]MCJ2072491.1 hypothetical protein [Methylobacterium sp. J-030]
MVAAPDSKPDSQADGSDPDLEEVNGILADWAARSASTSTELIDRFEAMGYEVRGKSEDEIADVLRRRPARPAAN